MLWPSIFNTIPADGGKDQHGGLKGMCWKASRIGERMSPYIGAACCFMAFHLLFLKA